MPQWARTFVLLTGMIGWLALVAGLLLTRQAPSAALVGFPAGLWIALNARSSIAKKRARKKLTKTPDDKTNNGAAA